MPVAVRNLLPTITCFNDGALKISVEWGVAGDSSGQDVQMVPNDLMEHPKFLRAVGLGFLAVEDDDAAIKEAVAAQAARYRHEKIEGDKVLEGLLERSEHGREKVISIQDMDKFIEDRARQTPAGAADL